MTTLALIIRVVVTLGVLALAVRLAGKRRIGAATPLDLLTALTLGVLAQMMVAGQVALAEGIVAVGALTWTHLFAVTLLARSPRLRQWALGRSVILVRDGKVQKAAIDRERLTGLHLATLLHEVGAERLRDVQELRMEPDGTLLLTRKPSAQRIALRDLAAISRTTGEGETWPHAA